MHMCVSLVRIFESDISFVLPDLSAYFLTCTQVVVVAGGYR